VILVDSSVWVDHLRATDAMLAALLDSGRVLAHPLVIGELALGNLRKRETILASLQDLPHATAATDREVLVFIEKRALSGLGISYVDAHLLASTQLTSGASLWTRNERLLWIAEQLDLANRFTGVSFTGSRRENR
jgi:predicted nucleic acid-binding protein